MLQYFQRIYAFLKLNLSFVSNRFFKMRLLSGSIFHTFPIEREESLGYLFSHYYWSLISWL